MTMMRKRAELRKELDSMNESISVISNNYKEKLEMLEGLRKEMDVIMQRKKK